METIINVQYTALLICASIAILIKMLGPEEEVDDTVVSITVSVFASSLIALVLATLIRIWG